MNLCEAKISLDEIIKSTRSQTNNKSPGNDGPTAKFYEQFSNKLALVLLDVYDFSGKLGTMLLLEQESYLSYIKKVINKILKSIDPYTIVLKNQLQNILVNKL